MIIPVSLAMSIVLWQNLSLALSQVTADAITPYGTQSYGKLRGFSEFGGRCAVRSSPLRNLR